jgi:hypothetical protein
MHNWWIAAFEHAGIWTHEEAEFVSKEIRLHIHKEDYSSAFTELESIISRAKGEFRKTPIITSLESDVEKLKGDVSKIKLVKKAKV